MYNIRSELQERRRNWHQWLFSGFCVVMFELTWYMFWWFDAEVNLKFYTAKYLVSEAVVRSCSVKKVFLEISQNSQETPVPESLFS